jgi:protocatechuate 3,4-dioxygenase beta subunit
MPTVLAGLLACGLLAQSGSAAPQLPASAIGTAQISGIVRSADDDKPLARARVVANADVLHEPRATITNSDGTYSLSELPAGAYTVSATRTGYAAQVYGQGRTNSGAPVTLGAGQKAGNIDMRLAPGGVIAGRILDEDGSPFAGAVVEALVTRMAAGASALYSIASSQTDDRGEFRLFGLAPGDYYVSAQDPTFRSVSSPRGVLHYSPTYYPGTPFADQAKTIPMAGTAETPRIEFRIRLVPPVRVSGRMTANTGKPLLSGAVIMSPLGEHGVPMAPPEDISIQADGRFAFNDVVPGRYQIRARGQSDSAGAALFAVFPVDVMGTDVEGISMTLGPGALVGGHVIVDAKHGTRRPVWSTLRVRAPFTDGNTFGDALTGTVQPDGTFAIRGVMAGAHQFVLEGLRPPWVVKSVSLRGADITDVDVSIAEREPIHDLRITITDVATEVSGVVQNAHNLPAANVGVLVYAKAPIFWLRASRRMRVTYTDRDGTFHVPGLPAGEYLAVAASTIDETDLGHRERLDALQAYAVPFRLATDDGRATVMLHVAPAIAPTTVR